MNCDEKSNEKVGGMLKTSKLVHFIENRNSHKVPWNAQNSHIIDNKSNDFSYTRLGSEKRNVHKNLGPQQTCYETKNVLGKNSSCEFLTCKILWQPYGTTCNDSLLYTHTCSFVNAKQCSHIFFFRSSCNQLPYPVQERKSTLPVDAKHAMTE